MDYDSRVNWKIAVEKEKRDRLFAFVDAVIESSRGIKSLLLNWDDDYNLVIHVSGSSDDFYDGSITFEKEIKDTFPKLYGTRYSIIKSRGLTSLDPKYTKYILDNFVYSDLTLFRSDLLRLFQDRDYLSLINRYTKPELIENYKKLLE